MRNKTLTAAVAATLGIASGNLPAATVNVTLTGVQQFGYGLAVATNISSSTASWAYDDATQVLTQTGGEFNLRLTRGPASTYFRHSITGLVIGSFAPASAVSFACTEGNYGSLFGTSLCGNYNFGANAISESTTAWGPGTSYARTPGGDDTGSYPQQSILFYDYFSTQSWDGTTLVLSNASSGALGATYQWTLVATPVPVPAAAWLFGSALGVAGFLRRKPG